MGGVVRVGARTVKIGIDINVKGLGVAFTCYDHETMARVYRVVKEYEEHLAKLRKYGIIVEYHPVVYTSKFVSLPLRLYIRNFKYPWDHLRSILEIWVRAHWREIRNWQRWNKPRYKRIKGRIKYIKPGKSIDYIVRRSIEPGETKRVIREVFRKYKLGYRIENRMAEELAFIVHEHEREWLKQYKMRVGLMITKVCRIVSRIARDQEITRVVVKLEELRGIEKKYKINVKLKRMRWRSITRSVCIGVTKGVEVGLVDPGGTSSECPICRNRLKSYGWERKYCPVCRREWNRDAIAGVLISIKPVKVWLKTPMKVKTRGGVMKKNITTEK